MIQRYSVFWFSLEKGLGLPSPPHFMYDFSRKLFLMLYSFNWPNFLLWLPLLFEVLDNLCIVIICFPVFDVINFEIYHNFLIKLFSYVTKKSGQKFKYIEDDKIFNHEIKIFFINFKGIEVDKTNFFGRWESNFLNHWNQISLMSYGKLTVLLHK